MQDSNQNRRAERLGSILSYAMLLAGTCLLATMARATDARNIEQELNARYKGKNLTLRVLARGKNLRFDAHGKLIKGGQPGPWTVASGIEVARIRVKKNALTIEAKRVVFRYAQISKRFEGLFADPVRIEIGLNGGPPSAESLQSAMDRLFLSAGETLADNVPQYWKPFVPVQIEQGLVPKVSGEQDELEADKKGITQPVPIHNPAPPPFTAESRRAGLTGCTAFQAEIDDQGNVANVRLVRPLGLGLDDITVETVRTWRFKPATRDGNPVTSRVLLETCFTLRH